MNPAAPPAPPPEKTRNERTAERRKDLVNVSVSSRTTFSIFCV